MRVLRSLRARLMLVFTGVAAAVLLAAAFGMATLLERAVLTPLDVALEQEAEMVAAVVDLDHPSDLARAVRLIGSEHDLGPDKFVRATDGKGVTLTQSGTPPDARGLLDVPSVRALHLVSLEAAGEPYRAVWYPGRRDGWAQIVVRSGSRVRTLQRARLAIAATTTGVLVILALLAWSVTTRATDELGRLAGELETIEAGSLHRRLAPSPTTEVHRLASVLNRLLGRLETAMSHLRRFTADAAHELRTPVAALRAHLEVTLDRARSPEAYRDGLIDALEQAERLGRLADDLLTLSAVEAGVASARSQAKVVRLDTMAREVADFLQPVAQEQGRTFACETNGVVAVRGAPELLKRVLLNLVDNAFRHTPTAAAVNLGVHAHHGRAIIEVRDGGPGIAPEELPFVFERFRRSGSAAGGAGLGLALCREIVAWHGGDIRLDSLAGGGTAAIVTLPLADERADPAEPASG